MCNESNKGEVAMGNSYLKIGKIVITALTLAYGEKKSNRINNQLYY